MGLGLTLQDDHVQVIFVEDGVYILLKNKPEIIGSPGFARHLETLQQVGSSFIVEDESLQERGLLEPLPYPVQAKTRQEVALLLARSDIVIPY